MEIERPAQIVYIAMSQFLSGAFMNRLLSW